MNNASQQTKAAESDVQCSTTPPTSSRDGLANVPQKQLVRRRTLQVLAGLAVVCVGLFVVLPATSWPWRYAALFLLLAAPVGLALAMWSAVCDLLSALVRHPVGERTRQFLGFQFIGLLTLGVLTLDLPQEAPTGQVLLVFLCTMLLAGLLPTLWPRLDWRKPLFIVVVLMLVLRIGVLTLLHVPALNTTASVWAGQINEAFHRITPDTSIPLETIIDPEEYAFFGPKGESCVYFVFRPEGQLRLYRQCGVDRATGLTLQPVTPADRERIVAWLENQQAHEVELKPKPMAEHVPEAGSLAGQ